MVFYSQTGGRSEGLTDWGLEHEITATRERISPLEDRVLEILNRADELAALIPQARDAVDKAQAHAASERARIDEQIQSKRQALALIDRDREAFRARLDPALLKDYDLLAQKYPGKVAVPVQGGASCGGCFTQLLPGILVALRKGDEPVRCQQCGRFLFAENKKEA